MNEPLPIRLLAAIAVGGTLVLASYVWGALVSPTTLDQMWGGVPEAIRPVYTLNMWAAAAGFFGFAPYLVFRVWHTFPAARTAVTSCFALILIPSALWLPLTARMVADPSRLVWWSVCADLALVAIGTLGLAVVLARIPEPVPRGRTLAWIGLAPFALQTVVLDALLWPFWFPVSYA